METVDNGQLTVDNGEGEVELTTEGTEHTELEQLKALRGKFCTYGGMVPFFECEHVKAHMASLGYVPSPTSCRPPEGVPRVGGTPERACCDCGCTEVRACWDTSMGEHCHWVAVDLCSVCHHRRATVAAMDGEAP